MCVCECVCEEIVKWQHILFPLVALSDTSTFALLRRLQD